METVIAGIRHVVSKNKRRFQEEGYDLDLVYVDEKIIAMGYPSEKVESIYRNSLDEVKRFLEERHCDKYKIYNLCSERCYDISKFHGRVSVYPFDDHNPPEFSQILPFCKDVHSWLEKDPENVACVHCKAGKGRTGLMICTYLLYAGKYQTAEDVLKFYGGKRTFDSNGVTIPSQRRYVDYFSFKISRELQYSPSKMMLYSIVLEPPPHVGLHHQAHVQFQVAQHFVEPFVSDVYSTNWEENKVVLKLKKPLLLSGDVKFLFTQKMNVDLLHLRTKPKFISSVPHAKLFHFWINTFFVGKQLSSELSHEVRVSSIPELGQTEIPRRTSYHKSVSSFTLRNRFAPLSLPDLKTDRDKEEEDLSKDANGGGGMSGLAVKLSKHQIDKASKDHTDRFPENFSVTLFVSGQIEDSWNDGRQPDPGIWMR